MPAGCSCGVQAGTRRATVVEGRRENEDVVEEGKKVEGAGEKGVKRRIKK